MVQRGHGAAFRPLNVHVARGSGAEKVYYANAAIPEALAGGLPPTPAHNLIDHGGKIIPDLTFATFYVGGEAAWQASDMASINRALAAAMSDKRLNNVMVQYFRGKAITSTFRSSTVLDGPLPEVMGKPDVEALVGTLYQQGTLRAFDLTSTVFCLMLPRGTILNDDVPAGADAAARRKRPVTRNGRELGMPGADDKANSLQGLGGYHGSVHPRKTDGSRDTVYYAVGVYSEVRDGTQNGIVAFDVPWKNVVATFYHELNEARTDADVEDAIAAGSDPAALGFLGWVSAEGEECGDFPVFEANPLSLVFQEVELTDGSGTVPIQFMYSNAANGPEGPRAAPAVQPAIAEHPARLPVREAPMSTPLAQGTKDKAHPDVSQGATPEPHLRVNQIQGNVLPGFFKDHQVMLFLKIGSADADVGHCKRWLESLTPVVATAEEVLAFNRLFKAIRVRRDRDTGAVKATWVNIAFSYSALARLTKGTSLDLVEQDFNDQSFKNGLAQQSKGLGDPTSGEGRPESWVVGGPHNEADIVLLVASDDRDDLFNQVEELEDSIYAFRLPDGTPSPTGVTVLFKQHGANLPGSLAGHEHFGFLDGVSQPGVRGFVSDDPTDVLTPRQNPRDGNQGKPGQDLLWPGEFVFGYPGQDPQEDVSQPGPESAAGPEWARDGSFLVFRRLRQKVGSFHRFLRDEAQRLNATAPLTRPLTPEHLGAQLVGRWESGAPILREKDRDDDALGGDDCGNNDFEFFKPDPSLASPNPGQLPPDDVPPFGTSNQCAIPGAPRFPVSPGAPNDLICPAAAHIRKAYPRDDITPAGKGATDPQRSETSERNTQTHRLLRRGLPFGPPSASTPSSPHDDGVDRGLLFLAHQTSFERQFEFVTRFWVNEPEFRHAGAGHDLIIGQNAKDEKRVREATVKLDGAGGPQEVSVKAEREWVIPTGGGYFFAPSIEALQMLSTSATA